MGFEQAGFEVVWRNENNLKFVQLYECGYNEWLNSGGRRRVAQIDDTRSIEILDGETVLRQAFGDDRPPLWGIVGGPPCPDFAFGVRNGGAKGSRRKLTVKFLDLVMEMHPTFFVMENVSGLYRIGTHRKFLEDQRSRLHGHSYLTDMTILNSIQFGVPQDRPRLVLIGINDSFKSKVFGSRGIRVDGNWFPFPQGEFDNFRSLPWPKTTPFGSNPVKPDGVPEALTVNYVLSTDPPPSELPNGLEHFRPHSGRFTSVDEGDTSRKSFKRLHRYRYSPTACYGNNEVHLHPWEPRRLSIREVMRIQGIPDSYMLPENGTLTSKFKLIGNGVPVPLASSLAVSFKEFITGANLY